MDEEDTRAFWLAGAGVAGAIVSLVNASDAKVRPFAVLVALLTGAAAAFYVAPLVALWLDISDPSLQSGIGFVIGLASKSAVQQVSTMRFADLIKFGKK